MKLPLQPPIEPMLATLSREIPEGDGWQHEMKVDGFRAIVFFDGDEIFMQSRDLKPLNRYFPELEENLRKLLPPGIIVDGEIVIEGPQGLDFDSLLLRIHPAASRVRMLAAATPSSFIAFDLLAIRDESLLDQPLSARRAELERTLKGIAAPVFIIPATSDASVARDWFIRFEGAGLDGVIAKKLEDPYTPGKRVMLKIKHERTVDCVVGGFRWAKGKKGEAIGSLLLGLYHENVLHYVGHASNFVKEERIKVAKFLEPYQSEHPGGFGKGRTPGGPSRWTQGKDTEWVALRPELVCEVSFDHLQGGERFRHAASFKRWRPDKPPLQCTYDQIHSPKPFAFQEVFKIE